jgi:hypothetical protein
MEEDFVVKKHIERYLRIVTPDDGMICQNIY